MKYFWIPTLLLLFAACDDDNGTATSACESDFNRVAMYENLADNLIVPAYRKLATSAESLHTQTEKFVSQPNQANLTDLRQAYRTAYLNWQEAEPYTFGPADAFSWRERFNNFPLNVEATEQRIAAGDEDFAQIGFTQGFPALDYLLYGTAETESELLSFFEENPAHLAYLSALTLDLKTVTQSVAESWETTHRDRFVANDGTAAGTSLSLLVNALNQHYEFIKRERFGIPSGVLTIGIANPERVEAPFSKISKQLAERALETSYRFYLGEVGDTTIDRPGLDDYLQTINAKKGDTTLDAAIRNQYQVALSQLTALEGTLFELAENEPQQLVSVYNEITKNLVSLKTDLPSVLCVSITYVDNPSDSD